MALSVYLRKQKSDSWQGIANRKNIKLRMLVVRIFKEKNDFIVNKTWNGRFKIV